MSSLSLAFSLALTFVTASLFASVGVLIARRRVSESARSANAAFAVWWGGAAATLALQGVHTLLGLFGLRSIGLHLAVNYAQLATLTLSVWGLLYYLVYVHTGDRRLAFPLAVNEVVVFLFGLYYYGALAPWVVEDSAWEIRVVGMGNPPAAVSIGFGFMLAGPIVIAAILYAALFRRVTDAPNRYRMILTTMAFTGRFGTILVGFAFGLEAKPWFTLMYEVPSLIAALLVLAAYHPPASARKKWGARGALDASE